MKKKFKFIISILVRTNSKFEKIIYNKIEEITLEQFATPSKQEKEKNYDLKEYFILLENLNKKLIKSLEEIKEIAK